MNHTFVKTTLGILAGLVLSVSSHAATVWLPADGTVNILQSDPLGLSLNGGTLALFEDTDNAFSSPLVLGSIGGTFEFMDIGGGAFSVTAVVSGAPVDGPLVIDGDQFILAVDWGNGYVSDSSTAQDPADMTTYLIDFDDGQNQGTSVGVDLAAVPLPAAAWLFGTALLGLAGVARRKA